VADFKSALEQAGMEGADADVRSLRAELKKAEAALKRSKTKDYYKILGIARDCTEVDIKKAYRRESLKHHPDKVPYTPPGRMITCSLKTVRFAGWR
jgi:DnaJ homolog subfamily C member 7